MSLQEASCSHTYDSGWKDLDMRGDSMSSPEPWRRVLAEESGFCPTRRALAACLGGESTGWSVRVPGPASEASSPIQFAFPLLGLDGSHSLEAKYVIHLVLCWYLSHSLSSSVMQAFSHFTVSEIGL